VVVNFTEYIFFSVQYRFNLYSYISIMTIGSLTLFFDPYHVGSLQYRSPLFGGHEFPT